MSRQARSRSARDWSPQLSRRRARKRSPRPKPATRKPRRLHLAIGARPAIRVLVLAFELAAITVLVGQPAFAAKDVQVDGIKVLSRAAIVDRADLTDQPSLFSLSADRIQARLAGEPYVKSVSVSLALPSSVHIHITEWEPFALVRAAGHD